MGHGRLSALAPPGVATMSLSGLLDATGSTSTITSTSRTVTVPADNSGSAYLDNLGGAGVLTINVNGAGYTSGPWTIGNGETITARGAGLGGIGVSATGDLIDGTTLGIIASITITRTS